MHIGIISLGREKGEESQKMMFGTVDWMWWEQEKADGNSRQSLDSAGLNSPVGQNPLSFTCHPVGKQVSDRDPSQPSLSQKSILKPYLACVSLQPSVLSDLGD